MSALRFKAVTPTLNTAQYTFQTFNGLDPELERWNNNFMSYKHRDSFANSNQVRHLLICITLGAFLLFGAVVLKAQQRPESSDECSREDAQALLPVLPSSTNEPQMSLILGVPDAAPSSQLPVNPDEFKALRGYSGPRYNVEALDGRVVVLSDTVYVWPQDGWKATGMFRNQTCQTIRTTDLTAHLLDSRGEIIEEVTALLPVNELRPGEPAPFTIKASASRESVKAVEWQVNYTQASHSARDLSFDIYEGRQVPGESHYSLFGRVRNIGGNTARDTHLIVAWLDSKGRVVYVDSLQIRMIANPTQLRNSIDMHVGEYEDFLYTSNNASLVSLLSESNFAIWGSAK